MEHIKFIAFLLTASIRNIQHQWAGSLIHGRVLIVFLFISNAEWIAFACLIHHRIYGTEYPGYNNTLLDIIYEPPTELIHKKEYIGELWGIHKVEFIYLFVIWIVSQME